MINPDPVCTRLNQPGDLLLVCFHSDSLEAEIHVSAPDGLTTWCATAFVLSENLGLGLLQEPAEVLNILPPLLHLLFHLLLTPASPSSSTLPYNPPSPPPSPTPPCFPPPAANDTLPAAAHRLPEPLRIPQPACPHRARGGASAGGRSLQPPAGGVGGPSVCHTIHSHLNIPTHTHIQTGDRCGRGKVTHASHLSLPVLNAATMATPLIMQQWQ